MKRLKPALPLLVSVMVSFWPVVVSHPTPAGAATVVINEISGFTDSTPVDPVGGNPGLTVGQQRSEVFQAAADWWGSKLNSSVPIVVDARFEPLSCSTYSGTLGSAGPQSGHINFTGAPLPNTLYVQALANSLAGRDLYTSVNDIRARFNSELGTTGCLDSLSWYYGLDQNPGSGQIDLYQVVLHEMAHGLGFLTWVNQDGTRPLYGTTYLNDAFMVYLEDHSLGETYPDMTNAERQAANIDTADLHWIGTHVQDASGDLDEGTVGTHVRMYAPRDYSSGSSVSHWDTALTPSELMEPSYAVANPLTSLTLAAMNDMGWSVNIGSIPAVTTGSISSVLSTSAACGGTVNSDNGSPVTARGVCWGASSNPDLTDSFTTSGSGTGSYTSLLTGLIPGTTYHVRAYATSAVGTAYGEDKTFTTLNGPSVTTGAYGNLTASSASVWYNVTSDNGSPVTARGVCWNTSSNPDLSDSHTDDGTGTGLYTSALSGLVPGTTYYVRAYATNGVGTSYGANVSFTTLAGPSVSTAAITAITGTGAVGGGTVTSDNGAVVTARGVCWGTSANPDTSGAHTTNGTGTGSFSSTLSGLTAGTTYHVRAYATNSVGTSYGQDVSFTTLAAPSVSTAAITAITDTSAAGGGTVTSNNGAAVTARGVCWGTSANPDIAGSHTTNGTGTGSFSSTLSGLTAGTTYHVRAYATNSVGTSYGQDVSFTTLAAPSVSTAAITAITGTGATGGGTVASDNGAAVTARGVCWGTSANPDLDNSFTSDGTGTGSFSSTLSGLTAGTTYHVRAYATNSVGTSYGQDVSFTALAKPSVFTGTYGNVTTTSVSVWGNVTADNGSPVTARGMCWGLSANPDLTDSFTIDGTGTGTYTSQLTGLSANTTYHVRAYATNSVGTAYGSDITVATDALTGVCPDCSGDVVQLENVIFPSGVVCECTATVSITLGAGVTVQSGATVTFNAPVVTTTSGFTAEAGSTVNFTR